MSFAGVDAALQASAQGAGSTLTLDAWGLAGLLILLAGALAGAGAGWALYVLSRRGAGAPPRAEPPRDERPIQPPPVAPVVEPPPAKAPEDPVSRTFEAAARSLPDGVLLLRGGRVERSAGLGTLLGPPAPPPEGLRLADLCATEDLLTLSEAVRSLDRRSGGVTARFRMRHRPAGALRFVSARLIRPEGAREGDYVAVLTDVTDAASAARVVTEVASRVTGALLGVPDGILVTGGEMGREGVTLCNAAFAALIGAEPGAIEGAPLDEARARCAGHLGPDTAARILPAGSADPVAVVRVEGESPRWIERIVRPVGAGESAGRLFLVRDITQAAEREEELRRTASDAEKAWHSLEERQEQILLANEGLEKRVSEFARFNRELRVIDEMKSNFMANVSHELQTPLVSIKGYTEMILKGRLGPLTEEQEKGLKVALRNVDRLIGLIESLLSFARSEKDAEPLRVEVFSLRSAVGEVAELLGEKAAKRRVTVQVQFPSGDLAIRADRNRIVQVFINLVSNAIKYNREGGRVEIEATRGSRAMARVEVRDTGEGIPREALEKVFERFYRGPSATGPGTGLGLSITRDILRLHGCQIRVDSEPGKGSVFSFTLPLETRGRSERAPRLTGSEREDS